MASGYPYCHGAIATSKTVKILTRFIFRKQDWTIFTNRECQAPPLVSHLHKYDSKIMSKLGKSMVFYQ